MRGSGDTNGRIARAEERPRRGELGEGNGRANSKSERSHIFLVPFPDGEDLEQVEDTENGVLEDVDAR